MHEEMNFLKTVAAALVAMLMFVGMFVITSPAFAEDETVLLLVAEYKQEKTTWAGEPIWLVSFEYREDILSFYADEPFSGAPIGVEIWCGEEVLDAQYILFQ